MAESSDSVSIDIERISIGGKEHLIQTSYGSLFVSVYGDQEKHALVTYPDVALNYMSCFQGLFFCPEASSLLLHNFCIYHISPPGHELGAGPISSDAPVPSAHELADQIVDVLDFFGLGSVMCMGVTAGAYILMLFVTRYRERVLGLILISPLCRTPSWTDWLYNQVMLNMLYYYGMCSLIKEFLLQRYFSKEVRGGPQVLESDIVQACRTVGRRGEGPHFAARSRLTSTGRNSRTDWCWTGSIVVCSLGSVYLAWAELQGVGLVLNPELLLVFDVLLTAALLLPSTVSCCVFLVGDVVVFVFLFLVYTCFGRLV